MELRSKCRKVKLEHGLDLVMIDYLQLMSGSGKNGDNRQQEISEISRSLKAIAGAERSGDRPVPAFPCLRDENGSQADASDLRESGAIEAGCRRCYVPVP